jgi:hypothetical protein
VGCGSHSRRKLTELRDLDGRVAYPLKLIARLYRLEPLADAKGLSPDQRVALRQERSPPVLEKRSAATHGSEPPASGLAKAAAYMIHHGRRSPASSRRGVSSWTTIYANRSLKVTHQEQEADISHCDIMSRPLGILMTFSAGSRRP